MKRTDGNKSLGLHRCRCNDKIKMDLKELGWKGIEWIDLVQVKDRWWALMNAVMKFWVPKIWGIYLNGRVTIRFSGS